MKEQLKALEERIESLSPTFGIGGYKFGISSRFFADGFEVKNITEGNRDSFSVDFNDEGVIIRYSFSGISDRGNDITESAEGTACYYAAAAELLRGAWIPVVLAAWHSHDTERAELTAQARTLAGKIGEAERAIRDAEKARVDAIIAEKCREAEQPGQLWVKPSNRPHTHYYAHRVIRATEKSIVFIDVRVTDGKEFGQVTKRKDALKGSLDLAPAFTDDLNRLMDPELIVKTTYGRV
jgi:hypothetical protein